METVISEVTKGARLNQETAQELIATVARLGAGSHTLQSILKPGTLSSANGAGLLMLGNILPYVSNDELAEKIQSFTGACIKVVRSQYSDGSVSIGYRTFKQLLERCHGCPEAEKALSSQVFGDLISSLSSTPQNADLAALLCLEAVLRRFARHCSGQRPFVEKYLIRMFDSENSAIVIRAGICGALVQQIRLSGDHGTVAKLSWSIYYKNLCKAARILLKELYPTMKSRRSLFQASDLETVEDTLRGSGPLKEFLSGITSLENVDNLEEHNSILQYTMLNRRLKNVLVYLQAALVSWYPMAKIVNPVPILELLFLIITLSKGEVRAQSSLDDLLSESVLPGLKIAALRTLDSVLECLQLSMLPYSNLFIRLVIQAIRTSKEHEDSALYRKLRARAYCTLQRWLQVVKCHNFGDPNASSKTVDASNQTEDDLIAALLHDVVIHENSIKLTVLGKTNMKNMSKKARRRLTNSQMEKSALAKHAPGMDHYAANGVQTVLDMELRVAALQCLETILIGSGCFLKDNSHRKIQGTLIQLTPATIFSSTERLALYKCLEGCRLGCKSGVPLPTQYLFQIFSAGVSDKDVAIASYCGIALRNVRTSLHQSLPSLSFAAPPFAEPEEDLDQTDITETETVPEVKKRQGSHLVAATPKIRKTTPTSTIHEAITQIDLAKDDTVIYLNTSGSDSDDDIVELPSPETASEKPKSIDSIELDSDEPDAPILEITDIVRAKSPQIIFSDVLEIERTQLSFPVQKVQPSQESTHSDDLVISCAQDRDITPSEDTLDAAKQDSIQSDIPISDKEEVTVANGVSLNDMLDSFVDEVNAS